MSTAIPFSYHQSMNSALVGTIVKIADVTRKTLAADEYWGLMKTTSAITAANGNGNAHLSLQHSSFGTSSERWIEAEVRLSCIASHHGDDDEYPASEKALSLAKNLLGALSSGAYPRRTKFWAEPQGRLVNIAAEADGGIVFEFGLPGSAAGTTLRCEANGSLSRYDYNGPSGFQVETLHTPFT